MKNVVILDTKKSVRERLEDFAKAYATNGGKEVEAYIEAGFSKETARQNAKKYLDKHHEYVMTVVRKTMGQEAAMLHGILRKAVADESMPWNHRLKAIEMMLKNSGIQREIIVHETDNASEMSEEDRKAEIQELMAKLA